TVSTNARGRVVGRQAVSDRSSGHAGRHWVSASTTVTPRPQISPAGDSLPFFASGGWYKEALAMLALGSPAGRTVSLASFSRSLTTRKFVGLSPPCTRFLP